MALTDNERTKKEKRTRNRAIDAGTNKRWSDKQKLEAVSSWLALGNLALVSRLLGIPEITIRVWKTSEWWAKAVEELKLQEKIELSARMKKLIEASHIIVAQRLETGDPILNQKTGEIVYKPVSLKDAHKVATDLIDRQKEVEKATRDDGPSEARNDDKLERLAEKFAEMATKSIERSFNKQRTVDAETVEVIDAVDEERETRLQTGVRQISGETGTNQEAFGTDSGEATS
jgi:hypothetical protein